MSSSAGDGPGETRIGPQHPGKALEMLQQMARSVNLLN